MPFPQSLFSGKNTARPSGADADEQVTAPDKCNKELCGQLRGAAHVLGFFGQRVPLRRNAIHHIFDGAVAQLHHDGEKQRQHEQDAFRPGAAEQRGQNETRHAQADDLAKGLLVLPRGAVAVKGVTQGVAQTDPVRPLRGLRNGAVGSLDMGVWEMVA